MDSTTFYTKQEASAERRAFYDRLKAQNAAPLWEVLGDLVRTDPRTACVATLWHYDDVRPFMMEAGSLITAEEAERRVLILENPGFSGGSRVTQSLYAGLQLILPGEIAHSHRHATSALRFVLEGEGAYTAVDGERVTMKPGDFILTPSWTYHDHGNPGSDPVVWLDGLDIPITNFFDTSFAERYPDKSQPVARHEGDALARYGSGMLPLEYKAPRPSAPMVAYSYARSREALEQHVEKRSAGSAARREDAVHEPGHRRLPAADDRRVPATAAERLRGPAVSLDRRDGLLRRRGQRFEHDRRSHVRLEQARYLRRALLASRRAPGGRGIGAVQLFRSSRTEGVGVMARRDLVIAAASIALTLAAVVAIAQKKAVSGDWPMYNYDLAGTRHSPLAQINTRNVGTLAEAWSYKLGKDRTAGTISGGSEFTPIAVAGVLYVAGSDRVVALEPDTGKETWRYTLQNGAPSRRGVTYWPGDATAPPRIFVTSERRLIALNAATGKPATAFGKNGEIDMGAPYNSAPTRYRNLLIVGTNGSPGGVRAFDARTGAKAWDFRSVPKAGEPASSSWKNESWKDRPEHVQLGVLANPGPGARPPLRRGRSAGAKRLLGSRSSGRQPLRQLAPRA